MGSPLHLALTGTVALLALVFSGLAVWGLHKKRTPPPILIPLACVIAYTGTGIMMLALYSFTNPFDSVRMDPDMLRPWQPFVDAINSLE